MVGTAVGRCSWPEGGFGGIMELQYEYKVILVNSNSATLKLEQLLNKGWIVNNAYGTANTLCLLLQKRKMVAG